VTTAPLAVADDRAVEIVRQRLEGVRVSGNQLSARCPLHRTEHPAQRPFSLELATGRCRCWSPKCAFTGNAQMLIRELGLESTVRVIGNTVDWGLPLGQYGITVDDHAARFPLYDHLGNRCRDHVRKHRGEPRFYFEKGERTYHAWVAWDLVREWGEGSGVAYIVEGDRDAGTLASHGWPSIGVLGVEHFSNVRDEVLPHVKQAGIGALVIVPDRDDAGRAAAKEWTQRLLADGFMVGVKPLPPTAKDKPVKDTYDLYAATGPAFPAHFDSLPVYWRSP